MLMGICCLNVANASKLSKYLNKIEAKEKARKERHIKEDMNFSNFSFRFKRQFTDRNGHHCREYDVRSKSNPYRFGEYIVCDER